jgi:hypothetical protein
MKNRSKFMKTTITSTRSSKVFAAGCAIANPFLLCRVTAVYARRLQKTQMQFAESINQSLLLISDLPRGRMEPADLSQSLLEIASPAPKEAMAATAL